MPITNMKSTWVSGNLVFFETAVGQGVDGDVLTVGTAAVKIGGTGQDVDFQFYGTGSLSAIIDCGAATYTLTGIDCMVVQTSSATTGTETSLSNALTLTGAGASAEAAALALTINAAAGTFTNALAARIAYGASGKTTGLGGVICAELKTSAGCTDGTYTLFEGELIMGDGALTGTATSVMNVNVTGAAAATFDTNGLFLDIQGVTPAAGKFIILDGDTPADWNEHTVYLKCRCGATTFYLLGSTTQTVD